MTTHAKDGRSEALNMRIEPKLKYLAHIAARYNGQTLSEFIESAIKEALSKKAMRQDEATPGTEPKRKVDAPLWNEEMWDEDEPTRLFLLATHDPELLTGTQMLVWTAVSSSLAIQKKQITLRNFIASYKKLSDN